MVSVFLRTLPPVPGESLGGSNAAVTYVLCQLCAGIEHFQSGILGLNE